MLDGAYTIHWAQISWRLPTFNSICSGWWLPGNQNHVLVGFVVGKRQQPAKNVRPTTASDELHVLRIESSSSRDVAHRQALQRNAHWTSDLTRLIAGRLHKQKRVWRGRTRLDTFAPPSSRASQRRGRARRTRRVRLMLLT